MNEMEQLQKQIDELKSTVDRLKSGETKIVTMSSRIQAKRREIFESYFGKWHSSNSEPLGNNESAQWSVRNEVMEGLKRLANITYKSARGLSNCNINSSIKNDNELDEYAVVYEFYCKKAYEQIRSASEAFQACRTGTPHICQRPKEQHIEKQSN